MVVKREAEHTADTVLQVLRSGGLAVLPCDTIYGFTGLVPDTEDRIRALKGREDTKPFLRLIGSAADLERYSPTVPTEGILNLWPGPLTLVVEDISGGTVALRVPDDPFLQPILNALGAQVYSTSVNRSGTPPMHEIAAIIDEFEHEVDIIVDAGPLDAGVPSTILDITVSPRRILRQGSLIIPEKLLD